MCKIYVCIYAKHVVGWNNGQDEIRRGKIDDKCWAETDASCFLAARPVFAVMGFPSHTP